MAEHIVKRSWLTLAAAVKFCKDAADVSTVDSVARIKDDSSCSDIASSGKKERQPSTISSHLLSRVHKTVRTAGNRIADVEQSVGADASLKRRADDPKYVDVISGLEANAHAAAIMR